MAIVLATALSKPAVVFSKVHLTNLQIDQPVFEDDSATPVYALRLSYRNYGVVDGVRYYDDASGLQTITIPDYLAEAMIKAAAGDMDLINALGGIELAVAKIIEDRTGTAATVE